MQQALQADASVAGVLLSRVQAPDLEKEEAEMTMEEEEYWNAVCIPLTQGRHTIVDVEDYEKVLVHPMHFQARCNRHGKQAEGYAVLSIGSQLTRLHQFLMPLPVGLSPDHRNRNPLDNRKQNLRPSTAAQNNWNKSRGRTVRKSKYKGLWLDTRRGCWHVKIIAHGVRHNLGAFKNEEDAAQAYNFLAHDLHGEFAVFNKVALP